MTIYSKLKSALKEHHVAQRRICDATGLSEASVSQILNHDQWPKRRAVDEIKDQINNVLTGAGVAKAAIPGLWTRNPAALAVTEEPPIMLLRRQGLFPETKRHFGFMRHPFMNDICGKDDVWMGKETRYIRETLYQTARHGGFLALTGESGSGKTVLRRDLIDRLRNDGQTVHVIEPFVLGMEDNDKTGQTLKSGHIAEAIMATVAPLEPCKSSPEARFRQVDKVLRDSRRAGAIHVLIIEEAHALPIPTLKHLKRYMELTDGLAPLLHIILIGQPELKYKLSESNHAVREVVQRCEMVELRPLGEELADFLDFKLQRAGSELAHVITPEGVKALSTRLTGPTSMTGQARPMSLVYPLVVGNMLVAAMNMAAEIGAPHVTPDIIAQI